MSDTKKTLAASTESPRRQPLAIVGASALFPGSLDAEGFWSDILAGSDLLTDVPPGHWRIEDYYDPDPSAPDKTYARRGGFLSDVDFDALGFGVPPSIVPSTDSAQLLALVVAQAVLDDVIRNQSAAAGELDRSRTSVILGVTSGQELLGSMVSRLQRPVWLKSLREAGIPEDEVQDACERIAAHYTPWQEATFPGLLGNVVAGRIANRLDLGGTNCVTDAACASTLSALAMGANELYLGDSDLVIVGGVDAMNDIFMFMCFSKTPALSPTGDCRPFSDRADGTMLGEGIGMVALKRLSDAEREGDRIYAVLEGVGTSSDGRATSVYAPRASGQAKALRRAYENAGYGPETVELVEAHGTGTKAGDAAEFEALRTVFEESSRADAGWCALGSVKSQIGHTKSAAGAAGLFKAVMALHHRVLPPTLKVDRPNPALDIETSPFYLSGQARPWVRASDHPRRASVSSFGFGGSNFHLTLSEYLPEASAKSGRRALRMRATDCELVVFTATSAEDLVRTLSEHAALAKQRGHLRWLARTNAERLDAQAVARIAFTAQDDGDLEKKLAQAVALIESSPEASISSPQGVHYGHGPRDGDLALLFPGQGSQYLQMGAGLAMHFDEALRAWDAAADIEGPDAPASGRAAKLHDVVFPPPAFDDETRTRQLDRLTRTEWAQPAIGCVSLAQLDLVEQLGLEVSCVGGHSFGEVMALAAAGVLPKDRVLEVAFERGARMRDAAETPGAMTAVVASRERVELLLADPQNDGVVMANHNGPEQVVVSGPTSAIESFETKLADEGLSARRLPVATAFHSPVVESARAAFRAVLDDMPFETAHMPTYSNALAGPYPETAQEMRDLLAAQITSPVRFKEMIEAMYEAGARTFLEVGPASVLTGLVDRILEGRPHLAVCLDRRDDAGVHAFFDALARLVAGGHALDLDALWRQYAAVEEPATRVQPKLTIAINGSNPGKPYPPTDGAIATPPPNAPRSVPSPAPTSPAPDSRGIHPMADDTTKPLPQPQLAAPSTPETSPVRSNGAGANGSGSSGHMHITAPVAPDWLDVMRETQRQTADAHALYIESMARVHTAYLDSAHRGLAAMHGTSLPDATVAYEQTPRVAAPVVMAAPTPMAMPPSQPHAMQAPPVMQAPPAAAAPAAAAPTEPVMPTLDMEALLLEVVSEKTGYPAEMLELTMALEGDLGIDSIKRVEILSAMMDRAPGLPEVDTTAMATLATLGEIVDYMKAQMPTDATASAPVATAPAAPPVTASVDLEALLLEVVSEKTGYPAEMLELTMALEGDLGIDSIKRVEILSAMMDRAPGLPEVDTTAMATLATLGEIVDYMKAQDPNAPPPPSESAATAAKPRAESLPLGRYALRAVTKPAVGLTLRGLHGGTIAITEDGAGVAVALVDALRAAGVDALVAAVDELPSDLAGLVFLGGLREVQGIDEAVEINREAFQAARALPSKLFVTVQDTGGAFGTTDFEADRAWLAGLAGLARTARQEWPEISVKAIDLERAARSPEELATALAAELLHGGPLLEIGLAADGRRTSLESVACEVTVGSSRLGSGDPVLVSGGARGVTAACVIELAKETGASFALLGRTELTEEPTSCRDAGNEAALKRALLDQAKIDGEQLTPIDLGRRAAAILAGREVRATLQALSEAGSEARYLAVDVTDPEAVQKVATTVRAEWGPIRGVIHGAGVLHDKLIEHKTPEQWQHVFHTKVEGLRALLAATEADPLEVLCLFSSVAARAGNAGQCDYAMANEVLNKVAVAESRRRGGSFLARSMGWGPWQGGMVDPALAARFQELGVPLIPLAQGARMLVHELASTDADGVELVLGGEPRPEALLAKGKAREVALEVRLSREAQPFLSSHAIDGEVVVPLAIALEWLGRAARALRPDLVLSGIEELRVLRGIRVLDFQRDGSALLTLHCRELSNGTGSRMALEIRGADDALHYSAVAQMKDKRGEPTSLAALPDLEPWPEGDIYEGGALFHGPDFHVIRSIEGVSDQGMAAELDGLQTKNWIGEHWRTDPASVDGALQMAVLWSERMLGGRALPTSVGHVHVWSDEPPEAPIHCVLRGGECGRHRAEMDLEMRDARGQLVLELAGVEMHLIGAKASGTTDTSDAG